MENPGVRSWLISCDESGVHGSHHYGFGSLWMKWQRRGDFIESVRELRNRYGYQDECKWTRVSKSNYNFYEALVDFFFERQWLVFHCIVVRKSAVRKDIYHKNDWDLARRKHYTMLLTSKMHKALRRYPDREQEFRIYIDPIHSSYAKADEAMEVITNNVLNARFRKTSPVKSVITRDSRETLTIQLCDLLLGAVMETWQKKAETQAKHDLRTHIAHYLGWPQLDSDTLPAERKFNIWYFFDPVRESRRVNTRNVNLVYPFSPG
ncbi:MAG: DUF3800 domain-containing protein [Gammaproteobacteria bacterium]|nr:DUF3800 domain-containing protein [Gammaproteobacteria bacterium]